MDGMDIFQLVLAEAHVTGETWDLEPSTATQPFVFDADGSLKPSLLGYPSVKGGKESLKSWRNTGKGLSV